MRKQLRWATLLCILSMPASVPAVSILGVQREADSSTALSFDAANDLIVINATINGKGPFRFLIDTGASHHVMTSELAQLLGLKGESGGVLEAGGLGRVSAELVQVAEVEVGGFKLERQSFFITSFPARFPFQGFIGAELFRRFVVRIDFQRKLLTLTVPRAFRYRGHGLILPIKLHDAVIPEVKAAVDGKPGWFKLDTGYNASLALFGKFIKEHGLFAKYKPEKSATGASTLTAEINDVPSAAIHEFRLGSLAINEIPAFFFPDTGGSNNLFAGAIGTGVLKKFAVTVDYEKRRMILESE